MDEPLNIFVVSDATGSTAEAVTTSVLMQFSGAQARVRRFPFVRTVAEVQALLAQAPEGQCIIIFTIVSPDLRHAILTGGRARGLTMVDLIGPLMSIFAGALKHAPSQIPGIQSGEQAELRQVTEAIHFTLRHILGVSRTGKTPTSIFLSCQKLKVANVPIVYPLPLPESVLASPAKKVGFRIALERLVQVRGERTQRMGVPALAGYTGEAAILQELEFCDDVYRRIPGLRTIDVTTRSVEEIAAWIKRQVL
jgi:regulator of PEP synthase PpsR (kinase-PPPase family)